MKASRKWVCARLATYENAAEAKVLERIFVGRSGQLENTVFAMLTPDGKTILGRAGRSPRFSYRDAAELAAAMDYYAQAYLKKDWGERGLPKVQDYRLALNIAACDGLPLILVGSDAWEERLARLVWQKSLLGQAIFVRGSSRHGATLILPDQFGLSGKMLYRLPQDIKADQLAELLANYQSGPKNARSHIREGIQQGVNWETRIPVTDPHSPRR